VKGNGLGTIKFATRKKGEPEKKRILNSTVSPYDEDKKENKRKAHKVMG